MEHHGLINGLVRILDKDLDTYIHSLRVGKLAKWMANSLNFDLYQERKLLIGCSLHDVGKVMIPDEILKKPSRLTASEFDQIKRHPIIGHKLLLMEGIDDPDVTDIVQFHHERWDGLGYPYGIKAEAIPVYSRICAIIDAYDCMISDRPYKKGISPEKAKLELISNSGTQFDPYYVGKFNHFIDTCLLDKEIQDDLRGRTIQII